MENEFYNRIFEALLYTPVAIPYLAAFAMLIICGLGVPIPEDITLFTMGYLAYNQLVDFKISVMVCLIGVILGDSIVFYLGSHYGVKLLRRGIFARLMTPDRLEKTKKILRKKGNRLIFAARFMPGLRAPTFFSAGSLHMPFKVFLFYDGLAALLSVPLLVGATFYFGDHIDAAIAMARRVQNGIVFLIVGLIILFLIKHFLFATRRQK